MKNCFYLSFCLLIFTLQSCDLTTDPVLQFDKPIAKNVFDLRKKLGDSLMILRGTDTINYVIYYHKDPEYNIIVKNNIDTIFTGRATKRKELILLTRQLTNYQYAIHALKLTDTTIIGLETEFLQSQIMDSIFATHEDFKELVVDTVKKTLVDVNKREGKDVFRIVIDKLASDKILSKK